MAEFNPTLVLTFKTDEDLSSSAYRCVVLGSDGLMGIATSDIIHGVTTDNVADGSSTEAAISVQVLGVAKCEAGASFLAGATVKATTGGKITGSSGGDLSLGIALDAAGADGDIVSVLIARHEA